MRGAYTLAVLTCLLMAVVAQDPQPQEGVGNDRPKGNRGRGNICKYDGKTKECSECDVATNTTECTLQLKKGPDTCAATKTVTINRCVVPGDRKRGRGKGRGGKPCKYQKGPWSPCAGDPTERVRTLTLKRGDATDCDETKTERKPCKVKCTYGRWTRGECVDGTMTKTREVLSGENCQATSKTKPCGRRG